MQIVDVLRDDARRPPHPVQRGERAMAASRPGCAELLLHGKTPAPGFVAHLLTGQECVERDRLVLRPQPAGGAKIGDAALGGNPGPGEGDDGLRGIEELPQRLDGGLQIGCNHVWFRGFKPTLRSGELRRHSRSIPCDICTPCCACAISINHWIFSATSWGSRRSAATTTRRPASPTSFWPGRTTSRWSPTAKHGSGAKRRRSN